MRCREARVCLARTGAATTGCRPMHPACPGRQRPVPYLRHVAPDFRQLRPEDQRHTDQSARRADDQARRQDLPEEQMRAQQIPEDHQHKDDRHQPRGQVLLGQVNEDVVERELQHAEQRETQVHAAIEAQAFAARDAPREQDQRRDTEAIGNRDLGRHDPVLVLDHQPGRAPDAGGHYKQQPIGHRILPEKISNEKQVGSRMDRQPAPKRHQGHCEPQDGQLQGLSCK